MFDMSRIAISFFAGAGGLDIGIHEAGFDVKLSVELEEKYCITLKSNNPTFNVVNGDIMDYSKEKIYREANLKDSDEINLIFGGSPCQSFSTVGKRKSFSDSRGMAMLKYIELIEEVKPKAFLLEKQRKQKNVSKSKVKGSAIKVKTINEELEILKELETERYQDVNVLFDLYVKREGGQGEYYSLKTVKPNLDQTEAAKKDMLRLMTAEDAGAYFALPYNPAGEAGVYKTAHVIPYKLFDMDNDENVLIGRSFWNKIGKDNNTYDELLEIFSRVGDEYITKIREEYLGIK